MEIQKPRGTKDWIGENYKKKKFLIKNFSSMCQKAGFERIETPMFEQKNLFVRSAGEKTDIVEKELFDLEKKSGIIYSLRPELTAGIVRSLIEDGLKAKPLPVMVYTIGEVFRYDRPQLGRYRQHSQLDLEIFGENKNATDIFAINFAWNFFRRINKKEKYVVNINSLGSPETKRNFGVKLEEYLNENRSQLCADCTRRLKSNPLRVLDCKVESCKKVVKNAPRIEQFLTDEQKNAFDTICETLESLGVEINRDSTLVRGLDYYTSTIFEITLKSDLLRSNSLGGGGRYDTLVSSLGGPDIGAFGFGLGIERTIDIVDIEIEDDQTSKVMVIASDESSWTKAIELQAKISNSQRATLYLKGTKISNALSEASKNNYDFAVIVGERELREEKVLIKNLKNETQQETDLSRLENYDFSK